MRSQRAGRTPGTGYVDLGTRGVFLACVRVLWCQPQADRSSAGGRSHEHRNRTPRMKSLAPYNLPPPKLAWQNSRYFMIHHWTPHEMTSWEVGRNPILMTCHLKLVLRREMLAVFSGYSWMYFSFYRRWEGRCVCQPRESSWSVQIRPEDRENCVSKEGTSCRCKLV